MGVAIPKVAETTAAFRRSLRVEVDIRASAEKIWGLLTNVKEMPTWNTTVTSMEGRVAVGERVSIRVPYSPRTFKVTVNTCDAPRSLVWSDGNAVFRGVRTYTLTRGAEGTTTFAMEEVFTGFMLPLIARSLPDFKPHFERYASDLRTAAERS